jgi:hypothetical protein
MGRNPTNEETLPSKQKVEEVLSVLSSENKAQHTEELSEERQCSSRAKWEKTFTNLRLHQTTVQKSLEDVDKLENYAHVDERLEKLHQRVNEDNAMKLENKKLNDKLADLEKQHRREVEKNQETINRLYETVRGISSENDKLRAEVAELSQQHRREVKKYKEDHIKLYECVKMIIFDTDGMMEQFKQQQRVMLQINRRLESNEDRMALFEKMIQALNLIRSQKENNDIIVAGSDVAVQHLSEAGYRKIKNKQVSHSFLYCQESEEFKQKFKGSLLSSGLLCHVVW